jgi:hypothetical protein
VGKTGFQTYKKARKPLSLADFFLAEKEGFELSADQKTTININQQNPATPHKIRLFRTSHKIRKNLT